MHVGHHAILHPSKIVIRSPSNIVLTLLASVALSMLQYFLMLPTFS